MIKRVKTFLPDAKINAEEFREYGENFESEITRGISTLAILTIIRRSGTEGIYGYQLLKELEQDTKNMLIIEEGTLYPILKKLEKDGIVKSEKKVIGGRPRNYYMITQNGQQIYTHLIGFLSKFIEGIGSLLGLNVALPQIRYFYCPNCANQIEKNDNMKFCAICGLNVEEFQKR